jgi:hypothetical protein
MIALRVTSGYKLRVTGCKLRVLWCARRLRFEKQLTDPAFAHARQLNGLGSRGEDLSAKIHRKWRATSAHDGTDILQSLPPVRSDRHSLKLTRMACAADHLPVTGETMH